MKPERSHSSWETVTLELKQVMEHVCIFPASLVCCGCVLVLLLLLLLILPGEIFLPFRHRAEMLWCQCGFVWLCIFPEIGRALQLLCANITPSDLLVLWNIFLCWHRKIWKLSPVSPRWLRFWVVLQVTCTVSKCWMNNEIIKPPEFNLLLFAQLCPCSSVFNK